MSHNPQSLYSSLWASADILRSKIDANEYKNYLLGIIFYKYLSDNMLHYAIGQLEEKVETLKEAQHIYAQAYQNPEFQSDLQDALYDKFSYVIEPSHTYSALMEDIHRGHFQLETLAQGFRNIEQSHEAYANLFQDIDLYSKKLGVNTQNQNETIVDVIMQCFKFSG